MFNREETNIPCSHTLIPSIYLLIGRDIQSVATVLNCTWLFWYSLVHFINRYWFRSCLEVKSLIQILFSALLFLFNFQISLYKTPSKIIPPLMEDSPFRPEQEIEGRSSIRGITVPSLWNHSFLRTWSYIQIKGKLWPKAGKTILPKII